MTCVNVKANLNSNSHAMNWILGCKTENSDTGPADACDLKFSHHDLETSEKKMWEMHL